MAFAKGLILLMLVCMTSPCWGYNCPTAGDVGGKCGGGDRTKLDEALANIMKNLSLVFPRSPSEKANCEFTCGGSKVDGNGGKTNASAEVGRIVADIKRIAQDLEKKLNETIAKENLSRAVKDFMVDRDWPMLEKIIEMVLEPSDPALVQAQDIHWTDGKDVLIDIVQNGRKELLTVLLVYDLDTNLPWGPNNSTMLHDVAASGKIDLAELLHSRGAIVDSLDSQSKTPLLRAVDARQTEMVAWLLGKGADVHTKDTERWTPLHFAAKNGDLETVKVLLNNGAIKEAINLDEDTPFVLATNAGFTVVADLIRPADPFNNEIPAS